MWWIQHKGTHERLELTLRIADSRDHGSYGVGYLSEGRVIGALRTTGVLTKRGLNYRDFELVNINGYTMDQMKAWPVEPGYSLWHRKEKWYWMYPDTGRVWYRRASDIEAAWGRNEKRQHREDWKFRRNLRVCPSQEDLEMVLGDCQGNVIPMPNWLRR